MKNFLDEILDHKKDEVQELKGRSFTPRSSPKRPFVASLDRRPGLAVIAEVKKASPSKGLICAEFDPVGIACAYEDGGASAISVLTDAHFFQGHPDYLSAVREAASVPVLRKDFIVDELQVRQTAAINADAMLLIAEALDPYQLTDLYKTALELDIDPLVELHSFSRLEQVLALKPKVIGINNRDLSTFITDIANTISLIKEIPSDIVVVSESGINDGAQARLLRDAGVCALLVGEALIKSSDKAALIKEFTLL